MLRRWEGGRLHLRAALRMHAASSMQRGRRPARRLQPKLKLKLKHKLILKLAEREAQVRKR